MLLVIYYRETRLSLNSSKDSTLYHSAIEKVIDTESSGNLEDLFVSGTSNIQGCTSYENNCSELYLSAVNELYVMLLDCHFFVLLLL